MTKRSPRTPGRLFRALIAHSARTAESYRTVWGAQRTPGQRTAEDIALHA